MGGPALTAEAREERALMRERACRDWCEEHQRRHSPGERQERLRALLPIDAEELHAVCTERWPCFYGVIERSSAGAQKLMRDLRAIRAVYDLRERTWSAPPPRDPRVCPCGNSLGLTNRSGVCSRCQRARKRGAA